MRIAVTHTVSGGDPGAEILACLAALYLLDCVYLRQHPETPHLYASGVRYQREPKWLSGPDVSPDAEERFDGIAETLSRGWGDCDDLAPWRAAELTVRFGIPARPLLLRMGPGLWHVVVCDRQGRVEDPSRNLGMGGPFDRPPLNPSLFRRSP